LATPDTKAAQLTARRLSLYANLCGQVLDDVQQHITDAPGGKAAIVDWLVAQGGTMAQDTVDALDAAVTCHNTHAPATQQRTAPIVQGDLP
jgi:hypothetical protein